MSFVPDVFKLTASLKEITFHPEIRILKGESYILQKVDHQCVENFVYHVPATRYPIWVNICFKKTIKFEFNWGPENYILDNHHVIMKKDFHNSLQVLVGSQRNILMPVFLKRMHTPYLLPLR